MIISSMNYIYVYLYNFIDTNLYNLSTFLSNIRSSIKYCQCVLHKTLSNIESLNRINSTTCLTQHKPKLEELKSSFSNLYDSYGYINYLRIETEVIMSKYKDTSSFESRWVRLINAFRCFLSEFTSIESLIICIRSTIQEILKLKTELMNSINTTHKSQSNDCKIKCLCDNIDALLASINNIEFYTYCLKCWICKFVNSSNLNKLSTAHCVKYISYFYQVFPLHSKTFQQLFYSQTLPGIKSFRSSIESFTTEISRITDTQINSLNQFISTLSRLESEIDCAICKLNGTIDDLLKFNTNVVKSLKSYLCNYIAHISNHYNQCHKSLLENIKTFECIQSCVESMKSVLNENETNGTNGSISSVKWVFLYLSSDYYVNNTIRGIQKNLGSEKIRQIDDQLSKLNCTGDSNDIDQTLSQLRCLKCLLSQFSGHIDKYTKRIQKHLIGLLSTLREFGFALSSITEISTKYYTIKHKVKYCRSSLKLELERLKSISSNGKILEKHLDSIIKIFEKYKNIEEKLKDFKDKLKKIQEDKTKSIFKLKKVFEWAISHLNKIQCISNCLKAYKNSVTIMTIKSDIEYIKSEIEAIQNIVASVQSQFTSLVEINLQVDCKTVNEIESFIKEIVSIIHKKYCCLSSITSKINIGECKTAISKLTSEESCKISKIQPCTTTQSSAQSPDSCKVCQTSTDNQECQCCQTNCQALQELISQAKSCDSNIKQNLNCIREVITKLTTTQQGQTTHTCPASGQAQEKCQTPDSTQCEGTEQPQQSSLCQSGDQAERTPGCTSQSDETAKLIQCILDQITKWQPKAISCVTTQVGECTAPKETSCQPPEAAKSPVECSKSNQESNSCKLGQVKLCLDTIINKCCCSQLKDFINKNIKSLVCMFECQIIFNFCELFCLYLVFDKSIVEYLLDCNNKLKCMKLNIPKIMCLKEEITNNISCIKKEIKTFTSNSKSLENHMKLAITEMECAIEGVVKNRIRCSLNSLSIHLNNSNTSNFGGVKENQITKIYSIYHVTNYNCVINRLFHCSKMIDKLFHLIPSSYGCKCIESLEKSNTSIDLSDLNVKSILDNLSSKSLDKFYTFLKLDEIKKITGLGSDSNHYCLCIINKYVLYPQLIELIYLFEIDLDTLSTISRKFEKYLFSTQFNGNIAQCLILTIELLYKVGMYILTKYEYKTKSDRQVEIICFCKYSEDSYYPYLVSIVLYISSLIENIWATDNPSILTAIQSLSNFYSELKIYDFTSIDKTKKICCGKAWGLLVNKKCGQPATNKCCWCVACYDVLLAYIYLCFQCALCKALCKNNEELCKKIHEFCEVKECTCKCTPPPKGCCLLKLPLSSQFCNNEELEKLLVDCCESCNDEQGCCKKIAQMVAAGGDLLVIGCKCESEGSGDQVKAQCVLFNNPWGGRSSAVVIVCKCEKEKCCCLTKAIEKIKEELKTLCSDECKCQELKNKIGEICNNGCCGSDCQVCTTLKEKLSEICGKSDCLCEKIKGLESLCETPGCKCKDQGCWRCVCCKVLKGAVRMLTRACRQNFLEPYKRIAIELLGGSKYNQVKRMIVNSINNRTLIITYLLKNNYSTHFNAYSDHKNIANRFPSLTVGYAYDTVYEHQVVVNSGYMGINGIREGYTNSRSEIISIRNKMEEKERVNVYTLEDLHTRVKTGNNIKNYQ